MHLGDDVLAGLPQLEGLVGLCLVDLATAQVLATLAVGDADGGEGGRADLDPPPALVAAVTECVHRLGAAALTGQDGDDVEDLVLTTGRHHHLVRLLPRYAGSDALLLLTIRRDRANLGLARHLLLGWEVALVA